MKVGGVHTQFHRLWPFPIQPRAVTPETVLLVEGLTLFEIAWAWLGHDRGAGHDRQAKHENHQPVGLHRPSLLVLRTSPRCSCHTERTVYELLLLRYHLALDLVGGCSGDDVFPYEIIDSNIGTFSDNLLLCRLINSR